MQPSEQNLSVSPPSVVSVYSSLPSIPQVGSSVTPDSRSRSLSVSRTSSKRFSGRVRWTMTDMTAMRMSPPSSSATRNSQPSRIRIINPSSTMRFVDANMNARKLTACAPFLNKPFPMATAPKLQPLLAAPNAVALTTPLKSPSPSTCAIRSLETYTWTRLVIVRPMMIAHAAVQRKPTPMRRASKIPSVIVATIGTISSGPSIAVFPQIIVVKAVVSRHSKEYRWVEYAGQRHNRIE